MRVIIITSSSNRSGGTRQALYQAQGLSARGHDAVPSSQFDAVGTARRGLKSALARASLRSRRTPGRCGTAVPGS